MATSTERNTWGTTKVKPTDGVCYPERDYRCNDCILGRCHTWAQHDVQVAAGAAAGRPRWALYS